jgi:hypothetical protein
MFDFLQHKTVAPHLGIRETLFGDMPIDQWLNISPQALMAEPWAYFDRANRLLIAGDKLGATDIFREILTKTNLESRFYLQAWNSLRELGIEPPHEIAKQLLGVVVEVGMPKGLDLVCAYADRHARYFNFSGAGVVWDRPNDQLDTVIDLLLQKSGAVVKAIGPWKEKRPAAPGKNEARINFLTPGELHFGQGPMNLLENDPMGGTVLKSAFNLMQEMIKLTKK